MPVVDGEDNLLTGDSHREVAQYIMPQTPAIIDEFKQKCGHRAVEAERRSA